MLLTPCPKCGNIITDEEKKRLEKIKLRVGESHDTVRCSKCLKDPDLLLG